MFRGRHPYTLPDVPFFKWFDFFKKFFEKITQNIYSKYYHIKRRLSINLIHNCHNQALVFSIHYRKLGLGVIRIARGIQQDLNDAIIRRINSLCKGKNWTYHKLSVEAGLSPQTILYIIDGKRKNISVHTIKKICDALSITLKDFYDTAYFEHLPMD